MWLVMVQTAALSVKSFCCPQPWPEGTRHWEVTWLHMKAALKGLWIKTDTLPEIPAPKLAVKNQVTSRRCQYVFVQQLTVVSEASPCPGNSCVTCPKEKKCTCKGISGNISGRWGGKSHSAAYEHGLALLMVGDCLLLQRSWNHGAGVFFPVAIKYLPSFPSDLPLCPRSTVKWESSFLQSNTSNNLFLYMHSVKDGRLEAEFFFVLSSQIILKSTARWITSSFFPDPLHITLHTAGRVPFHIQNFWLGLTVSVCLWGFVLIWAVPVGLKQ